MVGEVNDERQAVTQLSDQVVVSHHLPLDEQKAPPIVFTRSSM
jgi:hypothetical protein